MREKKTVLKKRKPVEDNPPQGSPVETEAVPAEFNEPASAAEQPKKEEGVSAPVLHGKKRIGKGAKKFEHPTDNNMSREVQGGDEPELDEGKPELEDGEPELEE